MSADRIRELNDAFRKEPQRLGKLVLTRSLVELGDAFAAQAIRAVKDFDDFDDGNDPHAEHDFFPVVVEHKKVFGKIDYYDRNDTRMTTGSGDPSDATQTLRVLTIMLAEDW